jgi:hypothetical protein
MNLQFMEDTLGIGFEFDSRPPCPLLAQPAFRTGAQLAGAF